MKTTHRCPKCNHDHILYIATVSDRYGDHATSDSSAPMKIAHIEKPITFLGISGKTAGGAGELEAGVCRSCGYTELYTKDPGSIPVDGTFVREIVAK